MRRTFLSLATLAILLQPTAALALAGGPTLVAQSSQATVATDATFTVTIAMDTKAYQVTAAELHLTFPADKLQATAIQAGAFLPSELTAGATGSGTASITVGSGTSPKQGTGPIAVVTFRALAAGSAQVAFASNTQIAAVGQASNAVDTMTPTTVIIVSSGAGATSIPSPTGLLNAGAVSTGPMESGMLALIVSAIAVLAYVGYASTDEFRRHEAQGIAVQQGGRQPNFKD